jgi:hypothetical protein
VGKKSSIAFGIVGIVLVVVAIVWWVALAPMLTKLPSDLDVKMDFQGQLTQYIDSTTGQSFPAGQEKVLPLTILRTFAALPEMYTSSVAVCDDTVSMNIAGQELPAQVTRYAMDRKTRTCIESAENWAYSPKIVLPGRVGFYGTLMPGGLKVGDTISLFSNDPAKVFDVKVVEKIDNYKGLGITVMKIDAKRASAEYYAPVAQALLGGQGLPMELTFEQLSAQLKAQGLDLSTLLAALASVASPEDMLSLQAMTQQPVKVIYKQESGDVVYVEQKTGATVGATLDRTTTMQVDTSGLLAAFAIIGKYASDPTIGPAITQVMQGAAGLATAPPNKVFNQNMTIIDTSEATLAADAKGKASMLNVANVVVPVVVLIVGILLLLLGGYLIFRARKASTGATPPATPTAATPAS